MSVDDVIQVAACIGYATHIAITVDIMNSEERQEALDRMQKASDAFYRDAVSIGNHPFIEFAGLMNEYITACRAAHGQGIDFTQCNVHNGQALPLHPVMSDYINEKLECIFSGSKVLSTADAS